MTRGIYCFTNKINNKQYVGQSMNIEDRYNAHRTRHLNKSSSMYSSAFYEALRKYGFENFTFEIIDSNDNYVKEDLNQLERYYIKQLDTYNNGYNMNYGGDSIYVTHFLSEKEVLEIRNKIFSTTKTFKDIALEYNVSDSLITQINQGKIWTEIGNFSYPVRENTQTNNVGGTNPNAILSDEDVMIIRKRFIKETLPEIYEDYKDRISFSAFKKVIYGVQFKSLPIYKKREKAWYLNGTCIDYPRIEE